MTYWKELAACAGAAPELFDEPDYRLRDDRAYRAALALCARCPVVDACAQEAAEYGHVGVWGGRVFTSAEPSRAEPSRAEPPFDEVLVEAFVNGTRRVPRGKGGGVGPERDEAMRRLAHSELDATEMADRLGMPVAAARRQIQRLGIRTVSRYERDSPGFVGVLDRRKRQSGARQ